MLRTLDQLLVLIVVSLLASGTINAQTFQWPVDNATIGQIYACRNCISSNTPRYVAGISTHTGVDCEPSGTPNIDYTRPVKAAAEGWIEKMVSYTSSHGMGNTIIVRHSNGKYSLYGHMDSFASGLFVGQYVTRGFQIGIMGNSAYVPRDASFGVHVHFEIKDTPTLGNVSDDWEYWGYTPGHPDLYGYHDPRLYVESLSEESITPVAVKNPPPGTMNVRSAPGLTYSGMSTQIINSIGADQRFVAWKRISFEGSYWYYIYLESSNTSLEETQFRNNGKNGGWVSGSVAVFDPAAVHVSVLQDGVRVRSGPGTSYAALAKIYSGERFITFGSPAVAGSGCDGQWYKIYISGNTGASEGWCCQRVGSDDFLQIIGQPCPAPIAITDNVDNITTNSATLHGRVNPNGCVTEFWFEYGLTTSYGSARPHYNVGSGSTLVPISDNISELQRGATYHYRLVASNSAGVAYGSDNTFATPCGAISIYGYVRNSQGQGVADVRMDGLPCPDTKITDGNGLYTCTFPCPWSGTVTPFKDGFTFSPPNRSYNGLSTDMFAEDFLASCLVPAAPTPPTASQSSVCSSQQYCINWSPVAGATAYEIQESGGSWLNLGVVTQQCYTKLNPGIYNYAVRAMNACGSSNASNSVQVIVIALPPAPVSTAVLPNPVCENTQYTVSWGQVSGATSYEISENSGGWLDVGSVLSKPYTKGSAGTFSYSVRAKNNCGAGSQSSPVSGTVSRCYDVSGTVRTPDGSGEALGPAKNFPVVLRLSGVPVYHDTTNSDGEFFFGDVIERFYSICCLSTCPYFNFNVNEDMTGKNMIITDEASGTVVSVEELVQNMLPEATGLAQNYPNPFNPTTEIQFSIQSRSAMTLQIFDITGRKIVTLADQVLSGGTYRAIWDGKDEFGKSVASGVYFYRLTTGAFAQTKKMLLLK